jgi:hypothetical protein
MVKSRADFMKKEGLNKNQSKENENIKILGKIVEKPVEKIADKPTKKYLRKS